MSGIQGLPSSKRLDNHIDESVKKEFVTVQPVGSNKNAMDTFNYGVHLLTENAVVEASSTDKILNLTAHGAKKGDVVRLKTTANSIEETEIAVHKVVDANTIELSAVLSAELTAGDIIDILRPILFKVEADGSLTISQGPIQINKDGSVLEITKDTSTPANTVAMPVEIVSASGSTVTITAGDINIQSSHLGANFDSLRLGDGTNLLGINASNEAKVNDADANTTLTAMKAVLDVLGTEATLALVAKDTSVLANGVKLDSIITALGPLATETTLALINGKVATETTLAALSAKLNSLGQKANATSAPVTLSSEQETLLGDIITAINNNGTAIGDIATEATLATFSAKFGTLGQKANSGSAAVTISTEQEAILDASKTAVESIDTKTPALGQAAAAGSVPVVLANNIEVPVARLDVVDLVDGNIIDTSVSNIPASSGGYLTIVASLASDVKRIKVIEDVGEFIGLYDGANTLLCILPQGFTGGEMDIAIASGTVLKVRNMKNANINADTRLAINFLG